MEEALVQARTASHNRCASACSGADPAGQSVCQGGQGAQVGSGVVGGEVGGGDPVEVLWRTGPHAAQGVGELFGADVGRAAHQQPGAGADQCRVEGVGDRAGVGQGDARGTGVSAQEAVQVPSDGAPPPQQPRGEVLAGVEGDVAVALRDLGQGDANLTQRQLDGPDQGLAQQCGGVFGVVDRPERPADPADTAAWPG
ncbi:hypothetical protein [Streptomyces hygroscopicus]|uniref:hypothetical protein n=1 Tax=Streptomyces hygroscopicus TaxID=1912 RepID=UPI0033E7ED3D